MSVRDDVAFAISRAAQGFPQIIGGDPAKSVDVRARNSSRIGAFSSSAP